MCNEPIKICPKLHNTKNNNNFNKTNSIPIVCTHYAPIKIILCIFM